MAFKSHLLPHNPEKVLGCHISSLHFWQEHKQRHKDRLYQAKNDKIQQNCKRWLCVECDEKFNHIINKWSKLAQKEYKTRNDWVGKRIPWELCKKFKFDPTDKSYMHNPESAKENETHQVMLDFDTQTDHLISARRQDLVIAKKRTCWKEEFGIPADHRVKLKESEL